MNPVERRNIALCVTLERRHRAKTCEQSFYLEQLNQFAVTSIVLVFREVRPFGEYLVGHTKLNLFDIGQVLGVTAHFDYYVPLTTTGDTIATFKKLYRKLVNATKQLQRIQTRLGKVRDRMKERKHVKHK